MSDGHQITFEREADQSPDITPGDVTFTLRLVPHDIFRRIGDNLYMNVLLTLKEALLGFERRIKHLSGEEVVLKRQGVTPPGFVQTVVDEGMPIFEYSSTRGKLYVEFSVAFPASLDDEQRKCKFGRRGGIPFFVSNPPS